MEKDLSSSALERMGAQLFDAQVWIRILRSALRSKPWYPANGQVTLIGSDYAGHSKKSRYLTYAFVVSGANTWEWDRRRWDFRQRHIPDNRRLSFKRFGKSNNPLALSHFLEMTSSLDGHLVVVVFEKNLVRRLDPVRPSGNNYKLNARWKPAALEEAIRKALLLALLANQYVPEHGSLDWITDDDPSIANDLMAWDMQRMAATLMAALSTNPPSYFGFGTTGRDCVHMYREDFVSIADFAAGMAADVVTHLSSQPAFSSLVGFGKIANFEALSQKSRVIASWFWQADSNFGRTCFLVEGTEKEGRVIELVV